MLKSLLCTHIKVHELGFVLIFFCQKTFPFLMCLLCVVDEVLAWTSFAFDRHFARVLMCIY